MFNSGFWLQEIDDTEVDQLDQLHDEDGLSFLTNKSGKSSSSSSCLAIKKENYKEKFSLTVFQHGQFCYFVNIILIYIYCISVEDFEVPTGP